MKIECNLGEAEAQLGLDACKAKICELCKPATIAICDSHGELIAFWRTDGCALPPIVIAQNKAYAAARARRPSGELGREVREDGFDVHYHGDARYVGWDGGLPVIHGGACVGAVAVSGLSGGEDVLIAQAGVDAMVRFMSLSHDG